jgi:hypothetical protein
MRVRREKHNKIKKTTAAQNTQNLEKDGFQ